MVAITEVNASNAKLGESLPGLVGVFVGSTSGIGEYTLKEFARYAKQPRAYFVGRSQEAASRIFEECKKLNPDGDFIFIKADTSLIKTVDDVCRQIKAKETAINILFMSPGTLVQGVETSENMDRAITLAYYSRLRFTLNLLPLLQSAPHLRRVLTVCAGGKEGAIDTSDWQGRNIGMLSLRPHLTALITLSQEKLAAMAPDVSFVHSYPGPVRSNIGRDVKGVGMAVFKGIFKVVGPLIYIPDEESGGRHVFEATSAMFPPGGDERVGGVPLPGGVKVAMGVNGRVGGGTYAVDSGCEPAGRKQVDLIAKYREDGTMERAWEQAMGEFKRITGVESV